MAERNNPYSMRVDLDTENRTVNVFVRERDANGEWVVIDSGEFALDNLPESTRVNSDLYGLSKLLQDRSSSISTGPDKLAAMGEVYSQLVAGQWERERQAGAPTVRIEVEAIARLKKISVADAQKALRRYDKEAREQIFASEKVQEMVKQIEAERSDTEVDLDDLAVA